uniref:Uncharacterized protein n=1 Tax=Megaselia scalaris TaxID=36166 RepID=T1GJ81_MEGSC
MDVRLFRANIDSDHNLVIARLHKKQHQVRGTKNDNTAQPFEEYITLKLKSIPKNPDINSHWNACVEEIRNAASEVLAQQEHTRAKGWRDAEYDMAVNKRFLPISSASDDKGSNPVKSMKSSVNGKSFHRTIKWKR